MFGMGFMEILLIAVVAIIALGPDKLPNAMVEIAKFIKKLKSGVEEAKSTLNDELNISEMKAEAEKFKAQIENTKASLTVDTKVDLGLDDIMNDDLNNEPKKKEEKISFKKKKKKKEEKETSKTTSPDEENNENKSQNKFKVNFDDKKEEEI